MDTAGLPGAFAEATVADPYHGATSVNDEEARQVPAPLLAAAKTDHTASPTLTASNNELGMETPVKETRHKGLEEHVEAESQGPRLRSSRIWKAKGAELLKENRERKKPLGLLDLPVDVLKEIVSAVTHTNDLTSLARCHSALHRLAIPPLFSKFDIIWPMETSHAEPRSGVDALTYGLATLVMAEEIFGEAPAQRGRATEAMIRRRRGNHYAQYTKKFSLGNGPADWVQEYLITKEGGKMLGTLVALAVARMKSLETFIWDMPTGVLRDVWMALSSLGDRPDVSCRLQKVWIRWHDNTPNEPVHPPAQYVAGPPDQMSAQSAAQVSQHRYVLPEELDHVEHPNFSILPPLKSLSVLDIDELAYLDEMAVCIERSLSKLEELRVGIARHAMGREWYTLEGANNGEDFQQVDYENPTAGSLTIGEKRLGGVLGTLTGLIHDMRQPLATSATTSPTTPRTPRSAFFRRTSSQFEDPSRSIAARDAETVVESPVPETLPASTEEQDDGDRVLQDQLQLDTLELERVPLSIEVMLRAFNWSKLTCLTILHCHNHDALWKRLREDFAPVPKSPMLYASRGSSSSSPRKGSRGAAPEIEMVYPLRLKRIHTNTVSPALIHFLKETLAPNTLEVLFLQEMRSYASSVTIEAIFKGPLRRHRTSLVKLLIDSSEKGPDGMPTSSSRWRRWMLTREILTFICSGKMPRLRELGMAVEYRDWHFFLQRLPSIPHLRSLYIPFLADHVHGADVDPRELALQIVDIVALRPEVELCYMGIANKCFEILENKHGFDARPESHLGHHGVPFETSDPEEDGEEDDGDIAATIDEDQEEDEAEDEDEEAQDDTESDSLADDDGESDDGESSNQARLRLREILFYDDKVAIFRARHGRL